MVKIKHHFFITNLSLKIYHFHRYYQPKFIKSYKHYDNYLIYEDGRCWSNFNKKFLKEQKNKYNQYSLSKKGIVKTIFIHKLVAEHFLSPKPTEKHEIDHIDQNKKNNHISNLRWATRSEQNITQDKHNTTGHRNIKLRNNRFEVIITRNNIKYYIGVYDTIEEAIIERDKYIGNFNQELERNE